MADRSIDDFVESIIDEDDKAIDATNLEDSILEPLLPEINLIYSDEIKSFVRALLLRAPEGFWNAASSHNGHSNPIDEHLPGGNILHIQRMVRCLELMCDAQALPVKRRDNLIAAGILSSLTKYISIDDTYVIDQMHPYTVDAFVQRALSDEVLNLGTSAFGGSSCLLAEREDVASILRLIRCQLGKYSPIPETHPASLDEWVLHFADLITTRLDSIIDGSDIREERWNL